MLTPNDLTGLAIVVLAALLCGLVMARLKQPAVVGYILAGVILGPSGFGLVAERDLVATLADLGVLMLLFLIGMELNLRGFMSVWKVAVPAALLQITGSLTVTLLLAQLFGWSLGLAALLGFVVALSSTAVVIKMLEQINILRSPVGQLTVGILIAQDLAVVPMILILQSMAEPAFDVTGLLAIVASVAGLVGLTMYLSRRKRLTLPFTREIGGQFDLRPLSGLTWCFGAAALTGLIGLSPAYGAFLAGLVIGNSTARAAMIRSTRPIQSVLMMVFFLSVGLLLDLAFIWENLATVAMLLLVVTVLKTALNIGILHLLREPWPHAFIAGIMLAQIGEFSFVLGQTGREAGLITEGDGALIVAVTALSLLFSPLWQLTARRLLRIVLLSVTSLGETLDTIGGPKTVIALQRMLGLAGAAREKADVLGEEVVAQLKRFAARTQRSDETPPNPAPDIAPEDGSHPDGEAKGEAERPPERPARPAHPGDSEAAAAETGAAPETNTEANTGTDAEPGKKSA